MRGALEVSRQGERLMLLPEKALFWPGKKALLIADTHFGKITHFRKAGIAVPGTAAFENLRRFRGLLESYMPEKVYFLGDLFHSELNTEWFGLKSILNAFPRTAFYLIQGNHDILHPHSYENLNFILHTEPLKEGPLLFSHEPLPDTPSGELNVCGHIHPGVRLFGAAKQSMRLPCFFFKQNQLIMPAFGEFTGLYLMKPVPGEEVYVCTGQEVWKAG